MVNLATPQPTRLADPLTRAMSRIDGCPQCAHNTEAPNAAIPHGAAWICHYRCTDCGEQWTTSWMED